MWEERANTVRIQAALFYTMAVESVHPTLSLLGGQIVTFSDFVLHVQFTFLLCASVAFLLFHVFLSPPLPCHMSLPVIVSFPPFLVCSPVSQRISCCV